MRHIGKLLENLAAYGSLPRDHERIVKRMDEGRAGLLHERLGVGVRVAEAVAYENDTRPVAAYGLHLDGRRRARHDDRRLDTQAVRTERYALRVVPGTRRDHAAGPLVRGHVHETVVGAADLERVHRLEILALEVELATGGRGKLRGTRERRLNGDVIHPCEQYVSDIVHHRSGTPERRVESRMARPACSRRARSPSLIRWTIAAISAGRA